MTSPARAETWACEIVGPPGVGKSTVIGALARAGVRTRDTLKAAGPSLVPSALGVLARGFRDRRTRPRTLQEFRWMTRLGAAHALVRGDRVVFDQGPIYTIARLTGAAIRRSAWLDEQTTRWSKLLDRVVLLDAPDDALIERIHSRTKTHELKGRSDDHVRASLAKWRALYAGVVSEMTSVEGGPAVMRIDTTATTPEDAAALILQR